MNDTKNVRIERTFDAPIERIWAMWTEEEHFANWYGPMGAEIPKAEMDVRVGGRRSIAMKMETPNGPREMNFIGEYIEISPRTRLVYTESVADADGKVFTAEDMGLPSGTPTATRVEVDLEDLDGSTRMVMIHVGVPADSSGAQGWEMAFDKLQERIAEHAGEKR